jgi:hypothetical protein
MRDRVLDLARDGMPDVEIATILTDEVRWSPNPGQVAKRGSCP